MKKTFVTTCFFLLVLASSVYGSNLKVVSYNIWNGFDWGKDTVRENNMIQWMQAQNPDLVALQELCGFVPEKLEKMAKTWGNDYSVLLKTSGYPVGLTSRYPIKIKERIIEGMHHGAFHCETNGIEVFVVHLSPFQWKKRVEETDILLKRINREKKAGRDILVCGDFNALSPIDYHLYKNNNSLREHRKKRDLENEHVENMCEGDFCFTAISKFLGAGLNDVSAKYTSTMMERISGPSLISAKDEADKTRLLGIGTRIDYILATNKIASRCIYATVANGKETAHLSDHYPVVAIFEN